jgi:hypothetical protein
MDWLFKRYANPFLFIDGMLATGRFLEFVENFAATVQEEKEERTLWEFFLHRALTFEGSFDDFRAKLKEDAELKELSGKQIETTVNNTFDILNNFNPEMG